MPNWIYNRLTISGDPEVVKAFREDVRCESSDDEDCRLFSFQAVVPVPEDILTDDKNGFAVWSQTILWGTKWEPSGVVIDEVEEHYVEYQFSTAWSPPIPFLLRASGKYPSLDFYLRYQEFDSDLFSGITIKNGEIESWLKLTEVETDMNQTEKRFLEQDLYIFSHFQDCDEQTARNLISRLDSTLVDAFDDAWKHAHSGKHSADESEYAEQDAHH